MTKRTFIAIDIYPDEYLSHAIKNIRNHFDAESIRWVTLDPAHITLAFLGDTTTEQIMFVKRVLKERLFCFGEFDIEVAGAGYFGKRHDPKVLWLGIVANDKLARLHTTVEAIIVEAGLVADNKPFRPHLTLGRFRNYTGKSRIEKLPAILGEATLMKRLINELVFYESILKPEGPAYKPIEKVSLS